MEPPTENVPVLRNFIVEVDSNKAEGQSSTGLPVGECDIARRASSEARTKVYQVPRVYPRVSTCQPKTAFDISDPINQPKTDPIYKHVGSVEWGEMMPAISMDGKYVAFRTVRGYGDADPEDNCASLKKGLLGYGIVEYCELDANLKCNVRKY